MTRTPGIFRSVTFWSGLVAMAFIVWAWWDSMDAFSSVAFRKSHVTSFGGGVIHKSGTSKVDETQWVRQSGAPPEIRGRWLSPPYLLQVADRPSFVDDFEGRTEYSRWLQEGSAILQHGKFELGVLSKRGWVLFIPYWTILLAVAVAWSGLLYWRHRRIRRAAIPTPAPP